MRFTTFQKTIVFAIAVLTFASILAAFYHASQPSANVASAKQGIGQDQEGAKRKWRWLSTLPPFLELVEIKNLDSDNWVTDLQIKIKNKSDKPIMYIDFYVFAPDLKNDYGHDFDAVFSFGDHRLWSKDRASEEDKLLQPGEEVVLTQKEDYKASAPKRLERALSQRRDLSSRDLRLEIAPHYTMFSDGTKYHGAQLIKGSGPQQSFSTPKYFDNEFRVSFASFSFLSFSPGKKKDWADNLATNHVLLAGSMQSGGSCLWYLLYYDVPCTGIACKTNNYNIVNQNTPGAEQGYIRYVTNPNCPSEGPNSFCAWVSVVPASNCGSCPSGQADPHYVCQNGTCAPRNGCGPITETCGPNDVGRPCTCTRPGETNPHYVCTDGRCEQRNFCGSDSGGCRAGIEQCGCPPGFKKRYFRCNNSDGCELVDDGSCGVDEQNCQTPGAECEGPCNGPGQSRPYKACQNGGPCQEVFKNNGRPACGVTTCFIPGCSCSPISYNFDEYTRNRCPQYADAYCGCRRLGPDGRFIRRMAFAVSILPSLWT